MAKAKFFVFEKPTIINIIGNSDGRNKSSQAGHLRIAGTLLKILKLLYR